MKESRVYVCHTYYHVYVTLMKELNNCHKEGNQKAVLVLSKMSAELMEPGFKERVEESGVFSSVLWMNEKRDSEFPELSKYRKSEGGFLIKMIRRIQLCKKFPEMLDSYIDIDFSAFQDIYIYCDEDPIGYYLNYKKIPYHAVEDGLDCNKDFDTVIHSNRKFWGLKQKLAKMGWIFLENGYSKYAIDMEVNDLSCIAYKHKCWKEVPRKKLRDALTEQDKKIIFTIFVKNADLLFSQCSGISQKNVLILSQPLCDLETRKRIFRDIVNQYGEGATVLIKPHPRDEFDYEKDFSDCIVLEKRFPVEVINFCPQIHFAKVISVITTAIDAIEFADEKINLGPDFLDLYEAPEKHRY